MQDLLKKIQNGKELTDGEYFLFFSELIAGKINAEQAAALLYGLTLRGETVEALYNLVTLLKEKSTKISYNADNLIDVCGTGGDGQNTLNISTAVAFVVASCDIKVAKHGNRSVSSKSGSSDVLQKLGVDIDMAAEQAKNALAEIDIAFLFAPHYHPALANVGPLRKNLGVRTIFNLIGPLLNPVGPKKQLIGLYSAELFEKYSAVVKQLDFLRVILLNSQDGLDEASIAAPTDLVEINSGKISNTTIYPSDFGFELASLADIRGGDAEHNAREMLKIFQGEQNAYSDMVALNSAIALYLAEKVSNIQEGVNLAQDILSNGQAFAKLNQLKSF